MTEQNAAQNTVVDIEVPDVPEPLEPEPGEIDEGDTYREGVGA